MSPNIKLKTTVKLRVSAHCPSHSLAEVAVRDVAFAIDEPFERGGTNTGPSPTDTAIAALVGCVNVIAHKSAARLDVDIGHLEILAVCDFDRRGVTLSEDIDVPFQLIKLSVNSDGLASEAELSRVADEVAKYCPASKLFRQAGAIIEESWTSMNA